MNKIILATLLSLFYFRVANGQANFEFDTLENGLYTSQEIGQMWPRSANLQKLKEFVEYLDDSTIRKKYPEKFLVLTTTGTKIDAVQFIGPRAQFKVYNVDRPPRATFYCWHQPSNLYLLRR